MPREILPGRAVIFEFRPVGDLVRVSAMDTQSLTEIVVQCPAGAGEAVFRQTALRRLEYVLKKKKIIT